LSFETNYKAQRSKNQAQSIANTLQSIPMLAAELLVTSTFNLLPPVFGYIVAGILGAIIGSFLNVVIHRLPREESIVFPNSRCPSCGAAIAFYDNVPIVSYLLLLGKCRGCKKHI
jgi:hypothetical protein